VLDVEGESSKLGAQKLTAWCVTWLNEVKKQTGKPVMVYTGANFARTYLMKELAAFPLWIAHYGVNKPMDNGTWPVWSAFQYSSSGKVPGITGNVDMNVMEKEFFDKFTKPPAPTAPKIPDIEGTQRINVKVNDKVIGDGIIIGGSSYVPIRAVADALGISITWDAATKTVTVID
jgi:lysozyme